MEKTTKIPLFRRCVIQNFPFIEEDFDALTDYGLLCKVVEYLNKVINQTNLTSEQVQELSTSFNQLKEYVDHYFDDLDIQEEVNNKLEAMVEDGTFEQIIANFTLASKDDFGVVKIGNGIDVNSGVISRDYSGIKFHAIAGSSATYIIQFPNGKNMIVDSGTLAQWTDIKNAIDTLGITKFDYAITTHFHSDHDGNNQNLIDTYDFTDCTWWIGMKPDYANHTAQILDSESDYNAGVAVLTGNGITPVVPTNESEVTIDANAGIKIQFFNTDATIAENYYSRYTEFYDTQGVNFNDFSLIANITYGNQSILLTGDIERPVEDEYCEYMSKATIMTAPHHGVNMDANVNFYEAVSPEITLCMFISGRASWIGSDYRQIKQIIKNSKKVITARDTTAVNGLFSFELNGDSVIDKTLGGGFNNTTPNFILNAYDQVNSLIYTTIDNKATLKLKDWLQRLPVGAYANIGWHEDYNTTYAQIWSDLNQLFYFETNYPQFEIMRSVLYYHIKVQEGNGIRQYFKVSVDNMNLENWSYLRGLVSGEGKITALASSEQAVTLLSGLPTGDYTASLNGAIDDSLLATTYYNASLKVMRESASKTTAIINGVARTTSPNAGVLAKATFTAFFDSSQTTKFKFYVNSYA